MSQQWTNSERRLGSAHREGVSSAIAAGLLIVGILIGVTGLYMATGHQHQDYQTVIVTPTTATTTATVTTTATTTTTTSTSTLSLVSIPPITTVFGVGLGSNNFTTGELPADTLIWETFTLRSAAHVDTVEVGFDVPSSSFGSVLHIGVYVNGGLKYEANYTNQGPSVNGSTVPSVHAAFPVVIGADFPNGTSFTIAVFCTGNLVTYEYNTGMFFESPASSLPTTLLPESAATSEPFQFYALGLTDS